MLNVAPLDPRATDAEICAAAGRYAKRVRNFVFTQAQEVRASHDPQTLTFELNAVAAHCGLACIDRDVTLAGRVGRMVDPMWWRRNLRRATLLENERIERTAGTVCKHRQCYVSDHAVRAKRHRRKAGREVLEGLEVVNEEGYAVNLLELADRSISNPAIRRGELMVRLRGFEEAAKYMGHTAMMLTMTCPSRFHRFNGAGQVNRKWTDETPKDAQKYMSGLWKKIRAKWRRQGLYPYGFRVAEPHADGCVHWHVLLFMAPDAVGWFSAERFAAGLGKHGRGVVGIVGEYVLRESPNERGATERRYDTKLIDMAEVSATGYIAKYISKNVDGLRQDGSGMGRDDESGEHAELSSERVQAWAKVHGLRQFQQIGGPSVTVWRELRRLGAEEERQVQNDLFEQPRAAAVRSLWALFWMLQGGPDVARKDLTLKPLYTEDDGGKYGEMVKKVVGVTATDGAEEYGLKTRLHEWTVQRAGFEALNEFEYERLAVRASAARILAAFGPGAFEPAPELEDAQRPPWTGINNCTVPESEEDDHDEKIEKMLAEVLAFHAEKGLGGGPPTEFFNHDTRRNCSSRGGSSSGGSPSP